MEAQRRAHNPGREMGMSGKASGGKWLPSRASEAQVEYNHVKIEGREHSRNHCAHQTGPGWSLTLRCCGSIKREAVGGPIPLSKQAGLHFLDLLESRSVISLGLVMEKAIPGLAWGWGRGLTWGGNQCGDCSVVWTGGLQIFQACPVFLCST